MTVAEILRLADEIRDTDPLTAGVLYALAGAKKSGQEQELSRVMIEFAKRSIRVIEYDKWLETAGK